MRPNSLMLRLYAVTDRRLTGKYTLLEQIEAALKNGATMIQLREKELAFDELLKEATDVARLCRKYNVPFIVNDDLDIAMLSGADGVHLGQDDISVSEARLKAGDDLIIGVSAHNIEEAIAAEANGADYLGVGAVFDTTTKKNVRNMPYDLLRSICDAVSIPCVAIGGINNENIYQLAGSGIDGVAVVSAVFAADDPGKATAELRNISDKLFG